MTGVYAMPAKPRIGIVDTLIDDAQLARLEIHEAGSEIAFIRGEMEFRSQMTGNPELSFFAQKMVAPLKVQKAGLSEVFVALMELRDQPAIRRARKEAAWDGKERRKRYDRRASVREAVAVIQDEMAVAS